MRRKVIYDVGHGGVAFGHYLTKGKRSPFVPPGIYEGEFNRRIARLLAVMDSDCEVLTPGLVNVSLGQRVRYVNNLHKLEPDLLLVSIHANAMGNGKKWHLARGHRVFYPAEIWLDGDRCVESRVLAESIDRSLSECGLPYKGRPVASRRFTMLVGYRKPPMPLACPAVLIECPFMTNRVEAEYMASPMGQERIARAICRGVRG